MEGYCKTSSYAQITGCGNEAQNGQSSAQQMLALAHALVPKPKLLMLDEPSLGLAPNLVSAVFDKVSEVNRETGVTILIVEQKVREVLSICRGVCLMKLGKVAFTGKPEELEGDREKLRELFL